MTFDKKFTTFNTWKWSVLNINILTEIKTHNMTHLAKTFDNFIYHSLYEIASLFTYMQTFIQGSYIQFVYIIICIMIYTYTMIQWKKTLWSSWCHCRAGFASAGKNRELFPRHRLQRKPLASYPGTHHSTRVTHVPWCMSGSPTRGGGKTFPAFPALAQPTRKFSIKTTVIQIVWVVIHCRINLCFAYRKIINSIFCPVACDRIVPWFTWRCTVTAIH